MKLTTVHTYRAPLTSGSQCADGRIPSQRLRLYAGTPCSGYAVDTFVTATAHEGARVYRYPIYNTAVLWLDAGLKKPATHMHLGPQALRELAGRLLDAAHDIEQHTAASLAHAQATPATITCEGLYPSAADALQRRGGPRPQPAVRHQHPGGEAMSANPFAPGAITRHQRRRRLSQLGTPAQRLELKRWLLLAAVLSTLAITLGLAAGLITGA